MVFKKGQLAWNKNKKLSLIHRNKISESNKSKKRTSEQRQRMSEIRKGKKHTEETRTKIGLANIGRNFNLDTKKKLSEAHKGEKHHNWKGGITSKNLQIRNSFEMRQWRINVFKRDGFKCQVCNEIGGKLEAHHIKSFSEYPELRFEINNGITLCKECHKLTDNYKGKRLKKE